MNLKKHISSVVIATALFTGVAQAGEFDLVCKGSGTLSTSNYLSSGLRLEGAVHINNKSITIPSSMLPGFNRLTNVVKRDKKNTFKLRKVRITDNEIKGKFILNPLNQPSVKIDRYSGMIYITGLSRTFSGECSKVEKQLTKKF